MSDYGTQRRISRVSDNRSLTAVCGFIESPSGTEMRRVFVTADLHEAYTITQTEQHIVKRSRKAPFIYLTVVRSPLVSHSQRLVCPSLCVRLDEWTQGGWGGRAEASQPQQSTSASAGRPCEDPCARECRCPSRAGMGSAMESRTCMRTERDATDFRGTNCPG